ncbi:hypothetical protein [Psychrobacter piscatorii]|uniref:hypothetical protein n=1 Tax=Psychrobacter piscatorii TaxID=554343 RepID=UPI003736738C
MSNLRLVVAGFATLIFMSIGCSNRESNSANEVKENPSEAIAKQIPEEVEMRGVFKRSFEYMSWMQMAKSTMWQIPSSF